MPRPDIFHPDFTPTPHWWEAYRPVAGELVEVPREARAVVNCEQAVAPFLRTGRLSDTERAMLMAGAAPRLSAGRRRRANTPLWIYRGDEVASQRQSYEWPEAALRPRQPYRSGMPEIHPSATLGLTRRNGGSGSLSGRSQRHTPGPPLDHAASSEP